jgi:hypothetical protein
MQQRLANPASLPRLEDGDRDLRPVTSFVIPDAAGDASALAAAWIDPQQRLVIPVVDFSQIAEFSRGWPPVRV